MLKTRKNVAVSFVEESRSLPFIKISIEGVEGEKIALVDTGSEITILDRSVVDKMNNRSKIIVRNANEVSLDGVGDHRSHGKASTFATFVTMKTEKSEEISGIIDGVVLDISHTFEAMKQVCGTGDPVMIIGSDTLDKLKAKIDYKKKMIVFNDLLCFDGETK